MEIKDVNSFLKYYSRVKGRTRRLFDYIPPEHIEWTCQEGRFTIGDLIRHLANIERYLYAETIQHRPGAYTGCGTEFASGLEATIQYYDQCYKESEAIFARLSDEDLLRKCPTLNGVEITTWKWLRALVEHEIHHRGQLYVYLGILGVKTPPIYGLTSEEVIIKSKEEG